MHFFLVCEFIYFLFQRIQIIVFFKNVGVLFGELLGLEVWLEGLIEIDDPFDFPFDFLLFLLLSCFFLGGEGRPRFAAVGEEVD